MKILSRRSLNLTGLKYNADIQDFQTRRYAVITEDGDLKYNLIYQLLAEGRVKPDGRLSGLIRTLISEIRLRDRRIEELEAKIGELETTGIALKGEIEELEAQIDFDRREASRREGSFGAFSGDILDEDGKIPGYYGA